MTVIAFALVRGAQPLVLIPVRVNCRGPFRFALDTGAGMSLVSPQLACDLGIAATRSQQAFGAGGKVPIEFGVAHSLAVGAAMQENVEVGITRELSQIGEVVGTTIDGALGYDFLRHYRVTLDYAKSTMELGERDIGLAERDSSKAISFRLAQPSKPLILIPAHVNCQGPFTFALDTGASATVISGKLAQDVGLKICQSTVATGGGGSVAGSTSCVDLFELGGKSVTRLFVMVAGFLQGLSEVLGTKLDGIVGYNFLSRFSVTIDYPQSLLALS